MFIRNLALAFFLVAASIPASSQRLYSAEDPVGHHGQGMMRGLASDREIDRSMDTLQQTLSLSPGQVANIRNLAKSRRAALQSIRENARPKFQELKTLLAQPNPNLEQVGAVVVEMKKFHEQARSAQKGMEKELMTLLDPTQQEVVTNLRNQAQTFYALRRLGLLGVPESQGGMFLSMMNR
jgi:Spy/CpxP family protein refolding chaperone